MYDLRILGWYSFQQLCLTITREVLGQTVQSFLDSNDGGRDGAFAGEWRRTANESLEGQFVIQCKFTGKKDSTLRPSDVSGEVEKVQRLVRKGRCDVYVLLTNAGLSGTQAEEVGDLFRAVGAKHVLVLGSTWISQQIQENKRLRMLVPRVYGLGDLSQILDERAYSQARAVLDSLREDLGKIVITDAYRKAAAALDKYGFVLLIGEPAAGKTTIASLLAMGAVDQWGASLLKLENPGKVLEHWNPDEPSQFFWLDDAFGVAQYEAFLVQGWNHTFSQIHAMLRKGAKIVMTSRDYIYNEARRDLKESAFPLLQESQVVIDVHGLAGDEKRQILYNHLKLGRQPATFRQSIKPYLESIAAHERFIPETARRLGEPLFTSNLYIAPYTISQFVEKREQFLREVLNGLDSKSKAALALIYMRNDRLESPVELKESEEQALKRLGSELGGCIAALEALNGSLVQYVLAGSDSMWRFKHPTVGDAYAAILVQSPELLGIYVQGSAIDKLIQQVTCGNVGIQNAVVIPRSLFPLIITRLGEIAAKSTYKDAWLARWAARSDLQGFLSRRCSKEFLALYLEKHPELLDEVSKPGLQLDSVPEVDLAARLHELDLLPENYRKLFVATVSAYALDGEDLYALRDPGIQSVFEHHEFEDLLIQVREEILPRLDKVRADWQGNFDSNRSADAQAHMEPLLDSLEALKKHFADDERAIKAIEREAERAGWWIGEHLPEDTDSRPSRELGGVRPAEEIYTERSIFDDIDA